MPAKTAKPAKAPARKKKTAAASSQRDPKTLTPSPLLDRIPMLNKVGTEEALAEYDAGLEQTRITRRIRVPITIIQGTAVIVDGRHRQEWAVACGLESVPVKEVTEAEGRAIIEEEIFARRHMTKSQRAWLSLWLNPSVAQGKAGRPKESDIEYPIISLDDAAKAAGVSRPLMKDASALYRIFTADKRFTNPKDGSKAQEDVEYRIWSGEGLTQILADLKKGPGGAPDKPTGPVDPAAAADAMARLSVEKFSQLLQEWDAELNSAKSHVHLPDAALHQTAGAVASAALTLAVATINRPDIPAAHKQQVVTSLREALDAAMAAAGEQQLKLK